MDELFTLLCLFPFTLSACELNEMQRPNCILFISVDLEINMGTNIFLLQVFSHQS